MHENKVQSCLTLSVKKLEKKLKYYGTANFNRDHQYNFLSVTIPYFTYFLYPYGNHPLILPYPQVPTHTHTG